MNVLQHTIYQNIQKNKKKAEMKAKHKKVTKKIKTKDVSPKNSPKDLFLYNNTITQTEFRVMGLEKTLECIKSSGNIEHLVLKHCNLENHCAQLLESLKFKETIIELDLSCKINYKK
jgi:hypothetical protein